MDSLVWILVAVVLAGGFGVWVVRAGKKKERTRAARAIPTPPMGVAISKSPMPTHPPSSAPISSARAVVLPRVNVDDDEPEEDITRITITPDGGAHRVEDEDDDTTRVRMDARAIPIVFDDDAALDEPTGVSPLILVAAAGQSDPGRVRRRNEDSFGMLEHMGVFVVADGMGGHAGGEVASRLAVDVVSEAFEKSAFVGKLASELPKRGAELVSAIQMANHAIFEHAGAHPELEGMGTTLVAARFSPNKQRVFVGHVGDSRCYRLRAGQLRQMTTDHNLKSQGIVGPFSEHLSRAVGIQQAVRVDLVIARPQPFDRYLMCSDGLTKMIDDERLRSVLLAEQDLTRAVDELIEAANKRGGRDNITVILVEVKPLTTSSIPSPA